MKKIIYLFLLLPILAACSKSDRPEAENSLIGKWKAEAFVGSDGANRIVTPIENGQTIILKEDNTFDVVDSQMACVSGNYSVTENSPQNFDMDIISLVCDNGNLVKYAYTFEKGKLLLSFVLPDGSTGCDEICAERYMKLRD